jgi:hypothetical protein
MSIACSFVRETYNGPLVVHRERIEYDHGRFRQTTLTREGKAAEVHLFDRNSQLLSYLYIPADRKKRVSLNLDSFLYQLALNNPRGYFKMHRTAPRAQINISEPRCRMLKRFAGSLLKQSRLVGRDNVDGKPCNIYELTGNNMTEHLKVWQGWVLESDHSRPGMLERITSLSVSDRLPRSTFEIPQGYTITAPKWAKINPPPGVKLKVVKSRWD